MMSTPTQEIKKVFDKIDGISGQKSQYRTLDGYVDELIDHLNDLIQQTSEAEEKTRAQDVIDNLLTIKEEELSQIKLAETESRGKGATVAKDRAYTRQLDSAIAAIKDEISEYL